MDKDQIITYFSIGLHLFYIIFSYIKMSKIYDKKNREILFISQLFCLSSLLNYIKFKGLM